MDKRALNTSKGFQFARYWTIRGITASLIVVVVLLPIIGALGINFWIDGDYNWRDAALELGVACIILSLIVYPAFYLFNWGSAQAKRWSDTQQDFRVLIDQIVDMVFVIGFDGRIIEVNQSVYNTLGYTKDEVKQLSILDLDIDCYLHRHPELVDLIQQGKNVTYQTHYRTKDGLKIPVESRARIANWLEGAHYVEFVSDISYRLEVEKRMDESREALEKTRNLLELRLTKHSSDVKKHNRELADYSAQIIKSHSEKMIDSMPSSFMVFLVSIDGEIKEANQKACASLGYSREELKQLSVSDLDLDGYLHNHPELIDRMVEGQSITYESSFRSKSGGIILIESQVRMANWLDEPHYVEIVSDISNRVDAEKQIDESRIALEQTKLLLEQQIAEHSSEIKRHEQGRIVAEQYASSIENYLEKLINSMPSALIAVDQSYAIVQWNIEAEKMTGIQAKLAIGESLTQLFPKLYQEIQKASGSRDLLQQNLNFQFKTNIRGEPRSLEVMMYPIFSLRKEEQGEVIRIDDVTDKLKINETLVQTEKMLSLGGLAAGMAHEINNPLGAIMQTTQNIKRRLSSQLDRSRELSEKLEIDLKSMEIYLKEQKVIEFLDSILVSGERAAGIVSDMLSFARPANKETTRVSLQETLDAAVRLSAKNYNQRKQFDFRAIDITRNYSPEVEYVMARKNQLQQVFLNLLVNAAQALSQADVPQPAIELTIRREGRYACVEVVDNGPGMGEETRKRVFEPFFTTKSEQVGTGLGLSVSYFIITEQLRGHLSVESQLDKGTRFIVHLPLVLNQLDIQEHDEQIELPL